MLTHLALDLCRISLIMIARTQVFMIGSQIHFLLPKISTMNSLLAELILISLIHYFRILTCQLAIFSTTFEMTYLTYQAIVLKSLYF